MTKTVSTSTIIDQLKKLFEQEFESEANTIESLPVSGSDRRYFRLSNDTHSAIGTYNPNTAENNTYFYFTELFKKHNISIPILYRKGKDRKTYLQQDLGNTSLFDLLMKEGLTDEVKKQFHNSLEILAKVQWLAGREVDYKQCFSTQQFDEKAIFQDLMYFKYYFADMQKVFYNKQLLISEMEELSKDLGRVQPQMLMYRDFQSRNIMVHEGKLYLIDYQGSMQGPAQYDIASLLWQAKAQLPNKWKEELLNGYIQSMNALPISKMDEMHFRRGYLQFVLLRLLQVLGAYGFRGLIEKKPHFISSIAPALKNLESFLSDNPSLPAYPELRSLLETLCSEAIQKRFQTITTHHKQKLTLELNSFSYKENGIPKDEHGNGGGFVFDCRGILNPGRQEIYKTQSGLDIGVKQFLEEETNMLAFLDDAFSLVSISIEDYMHRGFEHLSINFGCTGGQHRSVYATEKMASYIKSKYDVIIQIQHINQSNWKK